MKVFIGFDDTDTSDSDGGTGRLARGFLNSLPAGCRLWGVVRQQLLIHDSIAYTSHNSAACVVATIPDTSVVTDIIESAVAYVERNYIHGSDPGICVASETSAAASPLVQFGEMCTKRPVTQKDALEAACGVHLSGHGGTGDGIIGAAAAVGLTQSGWRGRFIDYKNTRDLPQMVRVTDLERQTVKVVPIDRDASVPFPQDWVDTKGWVRPWLMDNHAVLLVQSNGNGGWENIYTKRYKKSGALS